MPLVIVLLAISFNTVNGYFNGFWLSHFVPEISNLAWLNARIIMGILVFLTGFVINQYHDWLLIRLRKENMSGYQIPHGGLFQQVSCPNYLGEIIAWFGFFIVTLSLPAFSFLLWTMVNLVPRALDHHKWYKMKFPDYPLNRKAIIPRLL